MMRFLSKLIWRNRRLNELEVLILDTVRSRLDPELHGLWDEQVSSINRVTRLPAGVESDFYCIRNGKPYRDPEIAFPDCAEEHLLATVTLTLCSRVLTAEVWLVDGQVFCIEYSGGAGYFEEVMGGELWSGHEIRCEVHEGRFRSRAAGQSPALRQ